MSDPVGRGDYIAAGPVALIVGCGGMGMSVARALGKRHPLLVVDIDEQRLAEAEAALLLEGHAVATRACDITNAAETRALGEALAGGPGVKVLMNIAAVGKSIGSWKKMIDIDLVGAQLIADAVGPHMVKGGVAILISSLASYLPPADPRIDSLLDDPKAPGFYNGLVAVHGSEPDMDWAYNYAKLGINKLEKELLTDEKELAEHNMLVDLGRNDLGKISRFGTVKVEKLHSVERFSHVMHIGSSVSGKIKEEYDALDAIEAVLPAGTLSGAPKIRACQLIGELENNKRGIYGGAVGYIDFAGNMDTCIAIRMAYKKNGKVFVRSGAGIVADSVPEREYEECLNKAKATLKALELAEEVEE